MNIKEKFHPPPAIEVLKLNEYVFVAILGMFI